jgi:hypothetical protein
LKAFRPKCDEPAKFFDIHADIGGEVSGHFQDYSLEANQKFAGQALEAILRISPQFEKMVTLQGGTMEGLLDRFASCPEKSRCEK